MGSLAFIPSGSNPSIGPLSALDVNTFNFQDFTYPIDLGSNPELQHFVIFYINQNTNTQYQYNTPPPTGSTISNPIANIIGLSGQQIQNGSQLTINQQNDAASGYNTQATSSSTLNTNKTKLAVVLYMPPNISTNLNANWHQEDIGFAGNTAGVLAGGINKAGNITSLTEIINAVKGVSFGGVGRDAGQSAIRHALDTANSLTNSNISAGALGALKVAINPHAEVIFQDISFRGFQFDFKFTPRSESEAIVVDNIIQAFKFFMAPEINQGPAGPFFIYPGEFDIQFWSNGNPNNFLNKISTCALTSCGVNYTANGMFTSFKPEGNINGVTVETNLTLQFVELELMTKQLIQKGY